MAVMRTPQRLRLRERKKYILVLVFPALINSPCLLIKTEKVRQEQKCLTSESRDSESNDEDVSDVKTGGGGGGGGRTCVTYFERSMFVD